MNAARTTAAAARTIWDLASLPTRPLLCTQCGAYTRWISPLQRIAQAVTGRTPCRCGGRLEAL